jgi:hypothetical protein
MANKYRDACVFKLKFLQCDALCLEKEGRLADEHVWKEFTKAVDPMLCDYVEKNGWNEDEYKEKYGGSSDGSEGDGSDDGDEGDEEGSEDYEYTERPRMSKIVNSCIDEVCSEDSQAVMKRCVVSYADDEGFRSLTVRSKIYSPVGLPRYISMDLDYHFRARYSTCDYFFVVRYKLAEFPKKQEDDDDEGMKLLVSNEFIDCPEVDDSGDHYVQIENHVTRGLTPKIVRRMRLWLFGDARKS